MGALNEKNELTRSLYTGFVDFITYSGVLVLLITLKELEAKNIKGKILTSQYLYFTNPNTKKKLLSFSNIELRMVTDEDLHGKGYIFRKSKQYNLFVGSSNLTQDALASNKEWKIFTEYLKQIFQTTIVLKLRPY